ncbi:MAG: hypothetical protein LBI03_04300 [Clostridiales bacterium]|jgi:hypothetical protein|nr:hypothetical protein [Clostridiales bacterium]
MKLLINAITGKKNIKSILFTFLYLVLSFIVSFYVLNHILIPLVIQHSRVDLFKYSDFDAYVYFPTNAQIDELETDENIVNIKSFGDLYDSNIKFPTNTAHLYFYFIDDFDDLEITNLNKKFLIKKDDQLMKADNAAVVSNFCDDILNIGDPFTIEMKGDDEEIYYTEYVVAAIYDQIAFIPFYTAELILKSDQETNEINKSRSGYRGVTFFKFNDYDLGIDRLSKLKNEHVLAFQYGNDYRNLATPEELQNCGPLNYTSRISSLNNARKLNETETKDIIFISAVGILLIISLNFFRVYRKIILNKKNIAILVANGYSKMKVILYFFLSVAVYQLAFIIIGLPFAMESLRPFNLGKLPPFYVLTDSGIFYYLLGSCVFTGLIVALTMLLFIKDDKLILTLSEQPEEIKNDT